jgi:hypothetical protein
VQDVLFSSGLLLIIALNVAGWSGLRRMNQDFEYGAMAQVCGVDQIGGKYLGDCSAICSVPVWR